MIPDTAHFVPPAPISFRDADGCRLYVGEGSWTSEPIPGLDARTLHIPFWLGCVEQFEFAFDCFAECAKLGLAAEDRQDTGLEADPLIGALFRQLRLVFAEEIAFEVET